MRTTTRRNTLDIALDVLRCYALAQDAERWITVKPNGEQNKGRPVLIESETGEIKAGMGGKFTGRNIDDVPRGKNPHPVTEAKYQARQKRLAEKSSATTTMQPSAGAKYKTDADLISALEAKKEEEGQILDREVPLMNRRHAVEWAKANTEAERDELAKKHFQEQRALSEKYDLINDLLIEADRKLLLRGYSEQLKERLRERIYSALGEQPVQPQPGPQTQQPEQTSPAPQTQSQRPVAPKRPEGVPDGYWNGKVYSGNRVYIDGREVKLTKEKVEALQKWQNDYAEYKKAREADTKAAPKQYLDVAYEDRDEAKAAGARWDPSVKKWYWDKRDGDMPEALNEVSGRRERARQQQRKKDDTPPPVFKDYKDMSTEELRRVGKIYNDVQNEGGEGFNPYYQELKRRGEVVNPKAFLRAWGRGNWRDTFDAAPAMDADLAMDADNPANYPEMLGASGGHLALDRSSVRTVDENGYMHVKNSHITKATVNPYYGREIPGWREEGLDPDKVYYGLRDPEELRKSVPTWAGLPLHIEHHIDSAEDPQKLTRVGTVGTEIHWNEPYIDAPLTIWDQTAIDGIEDGSFRELSCAYRYDPDFTPGTWNGKRYDFVMRNIRGNHVALVEEGRAGSDVLVADAKPAAFNTRNLKPKKEEGLMSRFMKWFRGAQDGDPAVEKKEVDLAQAIIDLHRKDPVTGEIRDDVSEDADKAAEVRVLVERLKGKIPPDDYERLFGAIAALAAEEEAQDEEGQLMFEETKGRKEEERENIHADAMRAAGCDAEDPDEARAFAGGVKYGEELERNPAEREKLDREHESEGMRRAMDACGVDAENPSETKAFAEGVKYGEENARQKAEDEDPEDEDKPVGDEDKNAMIDKILAAVPDLTDEQKKKIADTLSDLAYSPATGDEELEKKVEGAADRAFRKRRFLGATDAARIRAQATSDAMARMRDIAEACRVVRPLVGEMDSLAFDSANDVYGYTLEQMGKRPRKYDRKAWRGMVEMLLDNHAALAVDTALRAREAKRIPDAGPFRYLKNITVG